MADESRVANQESVSYAVLVKIAVAHAKYGDFASMHEAYGVLAEEVAELFDEVRKPQRDMFRGHRIRDEAIQVAAVAMRIAEQAGRVMR